MNWLERKILETEIKNMLSKASWKTTTWGIIGILGTIAGAIYHFHVTGQFDFEGTLKAISAIAVGAGLIHAADHSNLPSAKILILVCLLALCAHPSFAQDSITNLYGAGVSYNNSGHPAVAGTAFFAKSINDGSGTFAFTAVDALPNTLKPFTVTTNISTGIAQKLFTIGKISVYAPVTAGFSWQGSNVGWAWSGGGIVPVKVKKNWYVVSSVRFAKSSVSNGTGYQLIPGIAIAWGE